MSLQSSSNGLIGSCNGFGYGVLRRSCCLLYGVQYWWHDTFFVKGPWYKGCMIVRGVFSMPQGKPFTLLGLMLVHSLGWLLIRSFSRRRFLHSCPHSDPVCSVDRSTSLCVESICCCAWCFLHRPVLVVIGQKCDRLGKVWSINDCLCRAEES